MNPTAKNSDLADELRFTENNDSETVGSTNLGSFFIPNNAGGCAESGSFRNECVSIPAAAWHANKARTGSDLCGRVGDALDLGGAIVA